MKRLSFSTLGTSRVVIGPEIFQTVVVRRPPEQVALCSPRDATGLFELEPQGEMLLPFEGPGVDAHWELRLPKAANFFDYSTIADVLITIDYTALNSFDYYQQVIQSPALTRALSLNRPFSFRHQLADQWFDLNNPDQTSTPMTIRFKTTTADFAFSRADGKAFEIPATLRFNALGENGFAGGTATSVGGMINTRNANGSSWAMMQGQAPFGEWELSLPDTGEIRNRFKNGEIEDILFVITYSGRAPEWPV